MNPYVMINDVEYHESELGNFDLCVHILATGICNERCYIFKSLEDYDGAYRCLPFINPYCQGHKNSPHTRCWGPLNIMVRDRVAHEEYLQTLHPFVRGGAALQQVVYERRVAEIEREAELDEFEEDRVDRLAAEVTAANARQRELIGTQLLRDHLEEARMERIRVERAAAVAVQQREALDIQRLQDQMEEERMERERLRAERAAAAAERRADRTVARDSARRPTPSRRPAPSRWRDEEDLEDEDEEFDELRRPGSAKHGSRGDREGRAPARQQGRELDEEDDEFDNEEFHEPRHPGSARNGNRRGSGDAVQGREGTTRRGFQGGARGGARARGGSRGSRRGRPTTKAQVNEEYDDEPEEYEEGDESFDGSFDEPPESRRRDKGNLVRGNPQIITSSSSNNQAARYQNDNASSSKAPMAQEDDEDDEDEELLKTLELSKQEAEQAKQRQSEDEELRKALEESLKISQRADDRGNFISLLTMAQKGNMAKIERGEDIDPNAGKLRVRRFKNSAAFTPSATATSSSYPPEKGSSSSHPPEKQFFFAASSKAPAPIGGPGQHVLRRPNGAQVQQQEARLAAALALAWDDENETDPVPGYTGMARQNEKQLDFLKDDLAKFEKRKR
ncbi:hypothetical protein K432DRAFT_128029 [Lepidopterella palustris CBS 459.81]|uniref:Uncharacterized protein n=1 Tax=Lepidopterella palustris CBS 459.81 TaxID=1314670 RepID=A0A8E2E498_9PEZI|nr:hypothetical protein K432DRAFT_128029 [Lepidopterella palustris CBS 459.81]